MRSPVFIDIEASALRNGYPIELGWAFADRSRRQVVSEAVLLDPSGTVWLASHAWDPTAERLHGITRENLAAGGISPRMVVDRFESALAGARELYSDSVDMDGPWLKMIYAGASAACTITLKPAQSLIVRTADLVRMGDLDFTAAEAEARKRAGPRHRAAPDSAYWAHLWLLVNEAYKAPPGTRPAFGSTRF
jgi:hypothetical protein